jgi:hypothetical protein
VAVGGEDCSPGRPHPLADRAEHRPVFRGDRVADRVREIEDRRSGGNGRLGDFAQEPDVRPGGVFAGEFDVGAERPGIFDRGDGVLQDLGARLLELVRKMDVRGRDEGMDARLLRPLDRFPGPVDVPRYRAGEPGDR